ncbi:hypothetical protein [[Scytonema hofmanni] UTEX B 1581]|uniref:hypothetical protein n=1 Tax=[Scytonema hofmanni] UTEX B 1581 TaxID=379535 RepID=UPI00163E68DD|nr:hypothetical protein [[Scytonema hofmanni] UTEX B 1581]
MRSHLVVIDLKYAIASKTLLRAIALMMTGLKQAIALGGDRVKVCDRTFLNNYELQNRF